MKFAIAGGNSSGKSVLIHEHDPTGFETKSLLAKHSAFSMLG